MSTEVDAGSGPRVIVALDYDNADQARVFARRVRPELCRLKVGKELFTRGGPRVVQELMAAGYDVFLDLKFHDIPTTVARACRAAADLGVWMVNVHASGGSAMLYAAREALAAVARPPLLLAVTILTSLSAEELRAIGFAGSLESNVQRLANLAREAGLDGVVCSAHEAAMLQRLWGTRACLVTPGIRPAGSVQNDQTRIMTPREALKAGASYLVIGRPITGAADPLAVLSTINAEISAL
ncbi:MAG: orotidine-5'-phosphate decarboxylase [Pseudomonadota bacterium]